MRTTLWLLAFITQALMPGVPFGGHVGPTCPRNNIPAALQDFRHHLGASLHRAGNMRLATAAGVSLATCRAQSNRQLVRPGLSVHRITGDGRCLFRALAQGDHRIATGTELQPAEETSRADEIRSQVCDQMLMRRDELAPFIDEDFDGYVAAMRRPHTWGGEPEVSVAPDVLQRPVDVFSNGTRVGTYEPSQQPASSQQPIRLLYDGVGHYDVLVEQQTPSKL